MGSPAPRSAKNRDATPIDGGYQYRAITEGPAIQRFWHRTKLLAIDALLPAASGDRVLDVGCGSGVVSAHLATSGARVTGIDGNPRAIDFATRRFAAGNLDFVQGQVDDALPTGERIDKIYCLEVIEHIYRHQAATMLDSFRRALAPAGGIFLTTPNYRSLWPLIEWAMDRSGRFPALKDEQHVERYTAGRLAALCAESGLRVERLTTVCLVSPWLAPLGRALAERTLDLEIRLPARIGSILVAVLRRGGPGGQ